MGTYQNTRERAEKGATLFADVLTKTMYGGETAQGSKVRAEKPQRIGWGSSVIWIIVVAIVGTIAYLFISSGGREMGSKVSRFGKREFGGIFGKKDKERE